MNDDRGILEYLAYVFDRQHIMVDQVPTFPAGVYQPPLLKILKIIVYSVQVPILSSGDGFRRIGQSAEEVGQIRVGDLLSRGRVLFSSRLILRAISL